MGNLADQLVEQQGVRADDFWPDHDTVMVAEFDHFEGRYPTTEESHTHRAYWRGKIVNDHLESLAKVEYQLWRHIVTKKGESIHCPACLHDRIAGFCGDIEKISRYYLHPDGIQYLIAPDNERTKISNRIRQHNSRAKDNDDLITAITFPLQSGKVVFLHDSPEYLGGELLPTDRAKLFDLVTDWAQPPKGKRAGHGIKKWIKEGPKSKRNKEPEPTKPKNAGDKKAKVGYFYGADYWLVMKLITENIGTTENSNGLKLPHGALHVSEFKKMLDAANVDYAIEGDINLDPDQGLEGERVQQPAFREVIL
jgi:hypothetical protein